MSSDLFSVTRHQVSCQHIREYPKATVGEQEETQYLEVKQYIPLNNEVPSAGDVTIIAAHANGFPKVRAGTRSPVEPSRVNCYV
jgi:hypothetical protein